MLTAWVSRHPTRGSPCDHVTTPEKALALGFLPSRSLTAISGAVLDMIAC